MVHDTAHVENTSWETDDHSQNIYSRISYKWYPPYISKSAAPPNPSKIYRNLWIFGHPPPKSPTTPYKPMDTFGVPSQTGGRVSAASWCLPAPASCAGAARYARQWCRPPGKGVELVVARNIWTRNNGHLQCVFPVEMMIFHSYVNVYQRVMALVVGGFNPFEKYESQLGWWNSYNMEKHVTNHQPALYRYITSKNKIK